MLKEVFGRLKYAERLDMELRRSAPRRRRQRPDISAKWKQLSPATRQSFVNVAAHDKLFVALSWALAKLRATAMMEKLRSLAVEQARAGQC